MDKGTVKILKMFLKLYAFDKCKCYGEMIYGECPIHGYLPTPRIAIYNKLKEELDSIEKKRMNTA